MLSRRELLKTGAAGVALLTLADCARHVGAISATDRAAVMKIADAMLDGAIPSSASGRAGALEVAANGFTTAVEGLPPHLQHDVQQLLSLLTFAPTRRMIAGLPPWSAVTRSEVQAFLSRWRFSRFTLLRSGYDALHRLVMAGWYGNTASWARIGYPGPPEIEVPER